jgi:hypothetical protein
MRRIGAVLAAVFAVVAGLVPDTAAVASATPVRVLQFNICHSGIADCYTGDRVMTKAKSVIASVKPQILSVNESCSGDVAALLPSMGAAHTTFVAARHASGAPVKCKNGQDYGNIVMVADALAGPDTASGVYTAQDTTSDEYRAWACIPAGSLTACTTHLSADSPTVAFAQCKELMSRAVGYAATAPVVVSGDMNLKYKGNPNVQDCDPSGFYRKGDGSLQHVFATTNLGFTSSSKIDMAGTTDHPAWEVTVSLG